MKKIETSKTNSDTQDSDGDVDISTIRSSKVAVVIRKPYSSQHGINDTNGISNNKLNRENRSGLVDLSSMQLTADINTQDTAEFIEVKEPIQEIISNVNNVEQCAICKDSYVTKSTIPCGCIYCYDCINRHLKRKRFCPSCHSMGMTHLDIKTEVKQQRPVIKLVKKTDSFLRKTLKAHKIDISGNRHRLLWRYDELICYLEAESYKIDQMTNEEIAYEIFTKEESVFNKNEKREKSRDLILSKLKNLRKNIKK